MPQGDSSPSKQNDETVLAPVETLDGKASPTLGSHTSLTTLETVISAFSTYSGPMPPPGFLAQYEAAYPGAAERLLSLAEKESGAPQVHRDNHRRSRD